MRDVWCTSRVREMLDVLNIGQLLGISASCVVSRSMVVACSANKALAILLF
jgi:hypothetical protein